MSRVRSICDYDADPALIHYRTLSGAFKASQIARNCSVTLKQLTISIRAFIRSDAGKQPVRHKVPRRYEARERDLAGRRFGYWFAAIFVQLAARMAAWRIS